MKFPKINTKIEEKWFCETDKLNRGQKGKEQTASRGEYKDVDVEDAKGHSFSTRSKI